MIEFSSFWGWAIFSIALIIGELLTGTFLLLGLGISALLVSILDAIFVPTFSTQLLYFALISPICIFISMKILNKKTNSNIGQSNDFEVGSVGVVSKENSENVGEIDFVLPVLGAKKWMFISTDKLKVGDKAKLLRVEGNYLMVEKHIS